MNIEQSIEVEFTKNSKRKEYYNVVLDKDYTVDFTLYVCFKNDNVNISVYDIQVFDNNGKYMTLTDMEYLELINEIIKKTKWEKE
ncbi:hypothetical protein [Flavobacterium sp.]|uniref:hypothetical protein n=1 Tax=Flavobacterium sp. TaxID=239 RepID=UPI0025F4E1CF|nr:hypothetical protein [Flavobacterium sp.]